MKDGMTITVNVIWSAMLSIGIITLVIKFVGRSLYNLDKISLIFLLIMFMLLSTIIFSQSNHKNKWQKVTKTL